MEDSIEKKIECNNKKEVKNEEKRKITIWRVFEYFIIYSIMGYIIETVFAFIVYGVIESRQSFLYGPFCSIYGVGAVVMILSLRYFDKNNYTLFVGGFIIGSIVEYIVSWAGEVILNTRWWDYSHRFLNINGRICFTYSIFWGLLAIYLMKSVNPQVAKFIDWIESKLKKVVTRGIISGVILFMFLDCIVSAFAENWVITKAIIEKDLPVANKSQIQERYDSIYSDEKLKEFVDKYWNTERILKVYPNLTTSLDDGTQIYIKTLYPNIEPYFYKMPR